MASLDTRGGRRAAFGAGVAGAAAMMAAAEAARSPVMHDLQELAGTIAAPPGSEHSELLGFAAQLVNGGLLAEGYLAVFRLSGMRPTWRAGLALGAAHGLIAGTTLGAVPALHPRVPSEIAAPRPFLLRRGPRGAVTLVALHALFGAVVGAMLDHEGMR